MTTSLDDILALTERVQSAIDAADWQLANELETERRGLLERFVVEQQGIDLATTLASLQRRNYVLIGQVEHHKQRVLREATMIKTGHAAVERYSTTATS